MAHGLADDLASAVLLATDRPVLVAPAMNPRMWSHPATRRNVEQLSADGVQLRRAGERARWRSAARPGSAGWRSRSTILAAIERHFCAASGRSPARSAIVTSGPTHEPIDPVRYLANRSSGRQGHAIAAALAAAGAEVTLVTGPVELPTPPGVRTVHGRDGARDAGGSGGGAAGAKSRSWRRPSPTGASRARRGEDQEGRSRRRRTLRWSRIPTSWRPSRGMPTAPGARHRLRGRDGRPDRQRRSETARKGCDWIVANDVSPETGIMGGDAQPRAPRHRRRASRTGRSCRRPRWRERLVARIAAAIEVAPATSPAAPDHEPQLDVPEPAEGELIPAEPEPDREQAPARLDDGSLDIRPTR